MKRFESEKHEKHITVKITRDDLFMLMGIEGEVVGLPHIRLPSFASNNPGEPQGLNYGEIQLTVVVKV